MTCIGVAFTLASCTNISPTAYKRTPPMNLKFLNCSQDSDAEGCDNDQMVIEKAKKSLAKQQNANMNIFDNFFANGDMSHPSSAKNSKKARHDALDTKKSPSNPDTKAQEPKRLGIEDEKAIEHKLHSSTHSKLSASDEEASKPSAPTKVEVAKPSDAAVQSPTKAQVSPKNAGAASDKVMTPSPSAAGSKSLPKLKAPVGPVKKGSSAKKDTSAPVMMAPVPTPAPATPAPVMMAPMPTPAPTTAPAPVMMAPMPTPAPTSGPLALPAAFDNDGVTPTKATGSQNQASPTKDISDAQPVPPVQSQPAVKSSGYSSKVVIPSQNYVRPKDIATGAVAFFYEDQTDDTVETKNPSKKANGKKMQLVSIAPSNEQILLSEEADRDPAQNRWKNKLVNAKIKMAGYFGGVKNKIQNLFNSKE